MSWIMVDTEANGRYPAHFSMLELGAVVVEPGLTKQFYAKMRPRGNRHNPVCMACLPYTHEESRHFPDYRAEMRRFDAWVRSVTQGRPRFISDNPAFDWQWVNDYLHRYTGDNVFGFTARDFGALYSGLMRQMGAKFDHLRVTTHTHNPLDDALGNGEAMLTAIDLFGLDIDLYGRRDHG